MKKNVIMCMDRVKRMRILTKNYQTKLGTQILDQSRNKKIYVVLMERKVCWNKSEKKVQI